VARTPSDDPDGWRDYLDGAEARYRQHGISSVLDRRSLEPGRTVSLFWTARRPDGAVVGGIRCHGPLRRGADAHALVELAGHRELARVSDEIDLRCVVGVVEMKGAWLARDLGVDGASDALARCCVHSMEWFDARFALCTSSTHAAARWASTGCRPMEGIDAVHYPDERYLTVVMWWDRHLVAELATADQRAHLAVGARQLRATSLAPARPGGR
jgi:hypothetical protein